MVDMAHDGDNRRPGHQVVQILHTNPGHTVTHEITQTQQRRVMCDDLQTRGYAH